MAKRIKAEEDRISNLPESILGHILSFLCLKQAAQTSILSKTWRQVWRSCPVVEFGAGFLFLLSKPWYASDLNETDREECILRRDELIYDLENVLQYRLIDGINIKRLTICMCLGDSEFASFVDRCVFYAILSGVKELKLNTLGTGYYMLPQMILSAKSIQVLEIRLCKFESSSRSNLNLPCLKKLYLCQIFAEDDEINDLIAKCPLLEDLSLIYCGHQSIKISSPNLKSLVIDSIDLVEVKITAPKLSIFRYRGTIISFDLNALALTMCTLCFWAVGDINIQLKAKFSKLLAKFHKFSKVLKLSGNVETAIVPQEVRRSRPSPLYGVKHFNFDLFRVCKNSSMLEVLDGLLWMAPHAETVSIRSHLSIRSFKFWYKKPLVYDGQTPRCCKSCLLSCWQHCIQHVLIEIGNFKQHGSDKVTVTDRYLFKGEELPGKINDLKDFFSMTFKI